MHCTASRLAALPIIFAALFVGTASAQDQTFASSTTAIGLGEFTSSASAAVLEDRPPLILQFAWYCDRFDGFFDNDGEFRDFSGGYETVGMYTLGAIYRIGTFGSEERPIDLTAAARLSLGSQKFTYDSNGSGSQSESVSGLENFWLAFRGKIPLTDQLSGSARVAVNLDLGNEDDNLTDGTHAIGLKFGLAHQAPSGLKTKATIFHTNRTDSDYRETNTFDVRASYPVLKNAKLDLRAGVALQYQSDTDEGGHGYSGGVFGKVDLANSPFSFGLDGGCTEDFDPTGNVTFAGDSWWKNMSVSLKVNYAVNLGD